MHLVEECARSLQERLGTLPSLAVVLGSGFQPMLQELPLQAQLSWAELPHFPLPSVPGHLSRFALCKVGAHSVLFVCGRLHFYEGLSMQEVTFPIRVLAEAGIRDLVLTNAAGGINRSYRPGDFMLLRDHINFMGENPLVGRSAAHRFVDLTQVYSPDLNALFVRAAGSLGITMHSGVYIAVSGPSYETPAEIAAFAMLGADAVGMSTVPEAIVARQCDMSVAALSCITNPAAGLGRSSLSHEEVLANASKSARHAMNLLKTFTSSYYDRSSGENDLRNSTEQVPSTLPK